MTDDESDGAVVSEELTALLAMRAQWYEEVRHLQTIRFQLISVYFFILGGFGYLSNFALSTVQIKPATLVTAPLFWVLSSTAVTALVALSLLLLERTSQYTDVIRTDLNRIYAVDRRILKVFAPGMK